MSSGAIINVYVKDRQFPVGVYEMPIKKKEVIVKDYNELKKELADE